MPLTENQLLYASMLLRMTLGLLAGIKLVKVYAKTKRWEMGMLAVDAPDNVSVVHKT